MSEQADPPPPPNYQPIAEASKYQAELSNQIAKEQLAWAKEQYNAQKPLTDAVIHSLIDTQNQNNENARKDRARYESVFQPLEDSLVNDARSYDNPERRAAEMGAAQAGVAQAYNAKRQNAVRDLEAFGINPGATRFAALDIGARVAEAGDTAAAGTVAAKNVENTGRALRDQAINIGRGYPAQSLGSYGMGNASGTGAVNAGNSTIATGSNALTQPAAYTGQAVSAIGNWGNIVNQGYQNQLAYYNAQQQQSTGLGSLLGFGASMLKPFIFAADGGAINTDGFDQTGEVPTEASPTRGKAIDDVPARLTAGEFVIPKDVASWMGEEKMHKLIEKARMDRQEITKQTGAVPEVHPAQAADELHRKAMAVRRPAINLGR